MPATTRSSGETKSVWTNNNTNPQADQREKEKTKHAILLIVLSASGFLVILVLVVIWLINKRKKYRKTFSSSDQSFTALVKE